MFISLGTSCGSTSSIKTLDPTSDIRVKFRVRFKTIKDVGYEIRDVEIR